jgi:hypothetical protein
VKLGIRVTDGAEVALKFIDRTTLQPKQMQMLAREVQAMNVLSHPNILTLLQVRVSAFFLPFFFFSNEISLLLGGRGSGLPKEARRVPQLCAFGSGVEPGRGAF